MSELFEKKCQACEGESIALNAEQIHHLLPQLSSEWIVEKNPSLLKRRIQFKNYYHTIAFVNALAYIAHLENHHPDLQISYNSCEIIWQTHALDGLSLNDFICAAKTDQLLNR